MTRYYVHANGTKFGPYEGLNAVAECLRERWAVQPGPDYTVNAATEGAIRDLTAHEHEAVVGRLVQIAQQEREEMFSSFGFEDLFARAA